MYAYINVLSAIEPATPLERWFGFANLCSDKKANGGCVICVLKGWHTSNVLRWTYRTRIVFSTKKNRCLPRPLGVGKIQMSLNAISNWNNADLFQQKIDFISSNDFWLMQLSIAQPSFGKELIIIYYFHYNRKSMLIPNHMHICRLQN